MPVALPRLSLGLTLPLPPNPYTQSRNEMGYPADEDEGEGLEGEDEGEGQVGLEEGQPEGPEGQ